MTQKELVNNSFTLHDQHCHSSYSMDSNQSLELMYDEASKLGCKYFITTEHIDLDIMSSGNDWLVDYPKLINNLKDLSLKHETICLLGVEIGYRKEYVKRLLDIINSYDFDVVNLSIHGNDIYDYYYTDAFENHVKETLTMYYQEMLEAVKIFPTYNVLSHIDYGFKTVHKLDPNYEFLSDQDIIKEILLALIKQNKALEINIKVQKYLNLEHTKELLEFYKSLGGKKVTLASDAHTLDCYHQDFDKYLNLIKQCGFEYIVYFVKQKEYQYYL